MRIDLESILKKCVEINASDIHLSVGRPPTLRIHGILKSLEGEPLIPEDTEHYVRAITSESNMKKIMDVGGADFGFAYKDLARFRVSAFRQKGHFGLVLRQLPNKFMTLAEIGLPANVKELLNKPRGLILVTGPTGSGKTTTLASMLDIINQERACHILTIEDPIEYYHTHKKAVVDQREIGVDVTTFSEALVKALRQDPDVILVGEMRDLHTMEAAITAAETGHLVFATLHTTGAARTVDRIIDAFPTSQQNQVRSQLSVSIVAVISQLLLPRADGKGRIAAFEIMLMTPAIGNLVREGKTFRITSELQTGARYGMMTLDSSLLELHKKGLISYEEMLSKSYDANYIAQEASAAGLNAGMKKA
ncbi:MAG: type IV pilus twitching motility protein PilT [Candidatus Omnitrophica bacterium]|nr:type IV pilus twitching motility protein PilT [Candidatus Omnitrophota bacterium]